MADLATLKTWLSGAEEARNALATGSQIVEVWRDGRRVKYSASTASGLDSYIDALEKKIAALEGASAGTLPRRRFIPTAFG